LAFLKNIQPSLLPDDALVKKYRQTHDIAILGDLYQRYMELVYGVCLKYYKDSETAKDSVMQVFEELVEKLKRHDVDNFKSWLYQVAKNHCRMQLRTPKNLKTVEFNPALMQNEENAHLNGVFEKEENFKKLEFCMTTLSDEQRHAVKLFYLDGKCYNDIVSITGQEWKQVRSAIQNGRRNLKNCMENNAVNVNQKAG
jgi:RNA polymerase sigma factor (sigma-70 family)